MKAATTSLHALMAFYDLPIERKAGRAFHRVPLRAYRDVFPEQVPHLPADLLDSSHVLIEAIPKESKLEFPGKASLESFGRYVGAGVASHKLEEFPKSSTDVRATQFAGTDLEIFDETDMYFECASVLTANDWADRGGGLSDAMVAKVVEKEGENFIESAKKAYGEEAWRCYAAEVAARHYSQPFSRLWYAANLLSLFYAHHDDLRFGYLLAEYRIKMSHEVFALKHIEVTEKNRESGAKGGQADKKKERYNCLDRLARQHFKDLAFASDKEAMRLAKRLAAEYDSGADHPLFGANGKSLSRDWFEEWLRHFRQTARGVE